MDYDFTPEWDDDWFTEFDYSVSDGFEDDYIDMLERWEDDCGYDPDFAGICHLDGSEDCLFCPFHDVYFKSNGANDD